jgi:CRISPR system Cascade subunit CasC
LTDPTIQPAYLDIHALQTLPYSNINRDDMGAPKTMIFGSVERTRVSSQSWKRAIRLRVEQRLGEDTVRTRRVVKGVAERLIHQGWPESEAEAAGVQVALSAGNGISLKPARNERNEQILTTSVLLLLPESGIDELAALAVQHRQDILDAAAKPKKKNDKLQPVLPSDAITEILGRRSGTINLFGRMLAELPGANVDGAVQMAHAFTTHGTSVEYDFFSAVDDIEQKLKLPGSGHIDTALFSSGTFYRYANIGIADLLRNLDNDVAFTRVLITEFLDAFIRTLPTGKQNPTAAATIPDLVHIAVRADRPVSLASAFEAPLEGANGYMAGSARRLVGHADQVNELLGRHQRMWAAHTITDLATSATSPSGLPAERIAAALGTAYTSFDTLTSTAVDAALPDGPTR